MNVSGEKETHESYSLIQFNRCSGSPNLFSTSVRSQNFISLEIRKCEVDYSLGRETHFASGELMTIWLSASQFSELITTMNCGSGVPCTIRRIQGVQCEEPPKVKSEAKKTFDSFQLEMDDFKEKASVMNNKISEMLNGKTVKKSDLRELNDMMHQLNLHIESNASFILKSFFENTQKIVDQAKTEVDNFITSAVHRTGLKSLKNMDATKLLDNTEKE